MPPKLLRKHCLHCDNGFNTFDTERKFCSELCARYHKLFNEIKPAKINKFSQVKRCAYCNKEFPFSRKNKIYCTVVCRLANANERYKNDRIVKQTERPCQICGQMFSNSRKFKYCGEACAKVKNVESTNKVNARRKIQRRLSSKGKRPKSFKTL